MSPTSLFARAAANEEVLLLTLTFCGVFSEVAMCAWGLSSGLSLWVTPLLLAHFHLGYVLAARVEPSPRFPAGSVAAISSVILAFSVLRNWWMPCCLSLMLFSTSIQALRRRLKVRASTTSVSKNICKAFAMLVGSAGVLPPGLFSIFLLAAGLTVGCSSPHVRSSTRKELREAPPTCRALLWFEGLHHAHYFAYVYVFWVLLNPTLRPLVGPFFVLGWLGYFFMERLLREKAGAFRIQHMILGHVVCAGAIGAMVSTRSTVILLALWFVTGAAGGTAYMLDRCQNRGNRELFEDSGHVLGCLAATLGLFVFGGVEVPLLTASALALAAAAVLVVRWPQIRKELSL